MNERQSLIVQKLSSGRPVPLDDIVNAVRQKFPNATRTSVNGSIRFLNEKLVFQGKAIVRVSKVGRGFKGMYQMVRVEDIF